MSSSKAMKMLGQQVSDTLKQCFTPNYQGRLSRSEYQMFWQQTTTSRNRKDAQTYLEEICNRLLTSLDNASNVSAESLINTVQFIALFVDVDPKNSSVKRFLDSWKNSPKARDFERAYPSAKDVVRTLSLRCEEQDLSQHLLIACSTLHLPDEYRKLSDLLHFPTFTDADIKTGESSFIFEYLRQEASKLNTPNSTNQIKLIRSTAALLRTLPQQMKANPRVAETTLLALLHMLKLLLQVGPVNATSELVGIINTVQDFYLWPEPFGSAAKQVLEALHAESYTPGASIINAFKNEYNVVSSSTHIDAYGQASRPLYYFVNDVEDDALLYSQAMELPHINTNELKSADSTTQTFTSSIQAMLTLNLLKVHLSLTNDEAGMVRRLSSSQVQELYQQTTLVIREAAQNSKPDEAQQKRLQGLLAVKEKMIAFANAESGEAPVPLPAELPDSLSPPLPPTDHVCVLLDQDPQQQALQSLTNILQYHAATNLADDATKLEVRIVIAGGNTLMHNVVRAYTTLLQTNPELFAKLNVKFFVAPLARNHFASFLARHDSWYNRHMYVPFRSSLFLLPWLRVDRGSIVKDTEAVSPPGALLRKLVESYVRESHFTLPVRIYQLECWNEKDSKSVVYPFLMRAEIGIVPDAREYQKTRAGEELNEEKKLYSEMSLDDLTRDNSFLKIFNPAELRVEFVRVDVSGMPVKEADSTGQIRESVVDDGASYRSLVFGNVPVLDDKCFPPNPTAPWLEMYAEPTENAIRNRARLRGNTLLSDPKQHVNYVDITCNPGQPSFLVRVDGQNVGPFQHVRISSLMNSSSRESVILPIQTFFPMEF